MPTVVFLRAANVGGRAVFRPSLLPARLPELDLKSLGAAGTFVAAADRPAAAVARAFGPHVPTGAGLIVCAADEILACAASDPFDDPRVRAADGRYLTVLERQPLRAPPLPLVRPASGDWLLSVLLRRGRLVVSVARRLGGAVLYPNAVVEEVFGVKATTRSWTTLEAIVRQLGTARRPPSARKAPR
jgi:hypothetical protein